MIKLAYHKETDNRIMTKLGHAAFRSVITNCLLMNFMCTNLEFYTPHYVVSGRYSLQGKPWTVQKYSVWGWTKLRSSVKARNKSDTHYVQKSRHYNHRFSMVWLLYFYRWREQQTLQLHTWSFLFPLILCPRFKKCASIEKPTTCSGTRVRSLGLQPLVQPQPNPVYGLGRFPEHVAQHL